MLFFTFCLKKNSIIMISALQYIMGPVVGGVIGYITNALAIRMLFRPYTPKYLFGHRLPFTPGIIPKEKGRIAASIGSAISENLMNREVLEKSLLSDEMIGKIRSAIQGFFDEQRKNTQSVREFLLRFLSEEEVDKGISQIKAELSGQVTVQLENTELGNQIADAVVEHVSAKLRMEGLDIPMGKLLGKFGSIWSQIADLLRQPLRNYLARNINTMLQERGPEIVGGLITSQIDNFSRLSVCELLRGREEQIGEFQDMVVNLYRQTIEHQLPKILGAINIPHIIEERINAMDMKETEELIFQVMHKELQAIIWLGALLGLIMGTVNSFI